ncbi:MAG: 2-phospho-L-lactate transferase CofD family protein, partial [Acidimicrobiia bacterium]|nr:2-phospho-L-lactate transferase CofD family protein [Acidimicrobiia bacterium]
MTTRIAVLSGGVGGARLARGFDRVPDVELTVIVNVGDDDRFYGAHVSPDIDTVLYTLAGIEGNEGWGRRGDSHVVMEHLRAFGEDTSFTIGDADLALNLYRTARLDSGFPLSAITAELTGLLGVESTILPVSDAPVRTRVQV